MVITRQGQFQLIVIRKTRREAYSYKRISPIYIPTMVARYEISRNANFLLTLINKKRPHSQEVETVG